MKDAGQRKVTNGVCGGVYLEGIEAKTKERYDSWTVCGGGKG
jgi:hypothetical protein